ncbi:hypothetical protein AVDCRST_MAG81-1585 [uncultured Synechococcales cyanobacterium]|uniref:Uncharacterized protein n=1 Tax=uncultured Synechococcales cyanobacterium TaxID=1936017 RepID=A0A6J4V7F1_9CYAN|nr:hypothetical protein AVDCRST_MAG81-1585 [uncultured Synechococcales cyanobacterium]
MNFTFTLFLVQPCQTQPSRNRAPRRAFATTPPMFLIVMLWSKMLDSNRTISASRNSKGNVALKEVVLQERREMVQ